MQRHSFTALNSTFVVDSEYEFVKELGQGAYGCVVAATHRRSGEGCAIKKITNINTKVYLVASQQCSRLIFVFQRILTKRCLREIRLHEELMEADLHAIIRSRQPLTDAHFQSFLYQTLCGLKYIHSANVLHRDLKPGNLLVNADCDLKICDFGLARGYTPGGGTSRAAGNQGFMTEYVATRWYRAPEIMLSFGNYLNQVLHYLGTPSEDTLRRVGSPRAQDYIRSLPIKPRVPFSTLFPYANPLATDLLSQMLCFDPAKRISCEQALNHPYFQVWHDPADEPVCEKKFDFGFEEEDSIEGMKKLIVEEVNAFRAEVRAQARASGQIRRQESLPIPSREEILNSPVQEHGPMHGATSSFTAPVPVDRPASPIMDDPSEELERELASTHLGGGVRA
ncbi:hypothetical protein C0995_003686 [Termitomyces sp. Mi166|nr:hypothetical protein C0995_003686 [Termitomyces sp. Mi166\